MCLSTVCYIPPLIYCELPKLPYKFSRNKNNMVILGFVCFFMSISCKDHLQLFTHSDMQKLCHFPLAVGDN